MEEGIQPTISCTELDKTDSKGGQPILMDKSPNNQTTTDKRKSPLSDEPIEKKKKVYRSIFGPQSKSDTDQSDSDPAFINIEQKSAQKSYSTLKIADIREEKQEKDETTRDTNSPDSDLSPEEKERYETITKELDILNSQSDQQEHSKKGTKLYTGPYGRIISPFKKFSSFNTASRGVKRSPRRLPAPKSKRVKTADDIWEEVSESEDETPVKIQPLPSVKQSSSEGVDTTQESSDEDKWEIVEESDTEIDKQLTTKSDKFSLTAVNVKSIIHKIITNENVVEMVRRAVQEELQENDPTFEPKMTRSRVKEVIETQGSNSLPWGLSPLKKKSEATSILDIDLPEEEDDDEDFNPDKVVEMESDEDSESVLSSCISDIGSPMPSTPSTSCLTPSSTLYRARTPSAADSENSSSLMSPMGPPLQIIVPRFNQGGSANIGRKFRDAMDRDEQRTKQEEEELIATRTRSKVTLKDISLLDIEANFVAPDITPDMYDTYCNDNDWQVFINTLQFDTTLTEDSIDQSGEKEDPDYNYFEEDLDEEYDREDFRNDRAVKVTKKELNLLIDELNDEYFDGDPIDEECKHTIKAESEKIVVLKNKKKQSQYQNDLVQMIGDHERRQIDDQVRKHVQLLTQTFVMAQNQIEEHKIVADTAKMFLLELDSFARSSEQLYPSTTYRVCNLPGAIQIVNDPSWDLPQPDIQPDVRERLDRVCFKSKLDTQTLPPLCYKQLTTLWTNSVFMFPELLPAGGFFKAAEIKKDQRRVKFIDPEDNLLAMGMEQFQHLPDAKSYIHRFMLPCKTKDQIQIRVKNLSANKAKSNVVKFWRTYKRLPQFPQCAPVFEPSMMCATENRNTDIDSLPAWCRFFRASAGPEVSMNDLIKETRQRRKYNKEKNTSNYSLSATDISSLVTPPSSNPATPYQPTDSSNKGSSSSSGKSLVSSDSFPQKRTKRPYRKRLILGGETPNQTPKGSFIPLSGCGSSGSKPRSSPITICVFDKLSTPTTLSYGLNAGVNTAVVAKPVAVSAVVTCVTPTIIMLNNITPVQASNTSNQLSSAVVTTLNSVVMSTTMSPFPMVTVANISKMTNLVGLQHNAQFQNIPVQNFNQLPINVTNCSGYNPQEISALTNEMVSNLKQETGIGNSENENDSANDNILSEMELELTREFLNVPDDMIKKKQILPAEKCVDNQDTSKHLEPKHPTTCMEQNAQPLESENPNQSEHTIISQPQALENSSRACVTNVLSDMATSDTGNISNTAAVSQSTSYLTPSTDNSVIQSLCSHSNTLEISDQNENQSTHKTSESVHDTSQSDHMTTQSDHMTTHSDHMTTQSGHMTPESGHVTPPQLSPNTSTSSFEGTPKNALEIMASYAPYFISPQQKRQETTPTKSGYVNLAPKPMQYSDQKTVDLQIPKVKSSPRRRQLNDKVRAILPKGFVLSTFDISPSKKVANNLVEKALIKLGRKQDRYKEILPHPPKPPPLIKLGNKSLKADSETDTQGGTDTQESEYASDDMTDDDMEPIYDNDINNGDDDDVPGDTESDYTQSEDGNETQDGDDIDDSQEELDSQEEAEDDDDHIANLMQASTTVRFDPCKDDIVRRMGKKDRDRDVTLAMLAPDIVESDPLRDDRDTGFAQAYLHKVKKALKDDMDTLEKFLSLMYNFSKTTESPLNLYNDLSELFVDYPDLVHDFAGFLLPEQAKECGCYDSYQEFNNARHFLRKLEIYFTKTPHQFQKLMKTLSRWYRKPSRLPQDLRDQIDPMLKGQRYLMEEFSRFLPDQHPPDSVMDVFEEIDLAGSDVDDRGDMSCDSFEEIELPGGEEILGTKRCTCACHDTGDDTYRKKKKHCYRCCLTVIDGELVFRVNKSTIKKINVKFGPPIKVGCLPLDNPEDTTVIEVKDEPAEENDDVDREPEQADWLLDDSETAEKENIEHFGEETSPSQEATSPRRSEKSKSGQKKGADNLKKSSFLQRISKLTRTSKMQKKPARLSSILISPERKSTTSSTSLHTPPQVDSGSTSSSASSPESSPEVYRSRESLVVTVMATGEDWTVFKYSNNSEDENVCKPSNDSECKPSNDSECKPSTDLECKPLTDLECKPLTDLECKPANDPEEANSNKEQLENLNSSTKDLHVDSDKEMEISELESNGSEISQSKSVNYRSLEKDETDVLDTNSFSSNVVECQREEINKKEIAINENTVLSEKEVEKHVAGVSEPTEEPETTDNTEIKKDLQTDEIEKEVSQSAQVQHRLVSPGHGLANDILAKAFNTALMTEISMDSTSLPFAIATQTPSMSNISSPKSQKTIIKDTMSKADNSQESPAIANISQGLLIPKAAVVPSNPSTILAPEGLGHLSVSSDSSFSKVTNKPFEVQESSDAMTTTSSETDKPIVEVEANIDEQGKMDVDASPSFSPFSPFSPFSSEIQSITSAQSPLASVPSPGSAVPNKMSVANKVRRITPIPVKGGQTDTQSLSSFETVVQNSPVLTDNDVAPVNSPFSHLQYENTASNSADVSNPYSEATNKNSKLSLQSADSETGSNSQKAADTLSNSQKSTSQDSGSQNSGSQNSKGSDTVFSNLTISQPVTFSEDANKAFPKSFRAQNDTNLNILSEESLFQCFEKPPQFGDSVHDISNLSNILHALDQTSLGVPPSRSQPTHRDNVDNHDHQLKYSKPTSTIIQKPSDPETVDQKEIKDTTLHTPLSPVRTIMDQINSPNKDSKDETEQLLESKGDSESKNTQTETKNIDIPSDVQTIASNCRSTINPDEKTTINLTKNKEKLSFSSRSVNQNESSQVIAKANTDTSSSETEDSETDSSDSEEEKEIVKQTSSPSNYFPQKSRSIENLQRVQLGYFKISTLTDSESSCNTTPSSSLTNLVGKSGTKQTTEAENKEIAESEAKKIKEAITNTDKRLESEISESVTTAKDIGNEVRSETDVTKIDISTKSNENISNKYEGDIANDLPKIHTATDDSDKPMIKQKITESVETFCSVTDIKSVALPTCSTGQSSTPDLAQSIKNESHRKKKKRHKGDSSQSDTKSKHRSKGKSKHRKHSKSKISKEQVETTSDGLKPDSEILKSKSSIDGNQLGEKYVGTSKQQNDSNQSTVQNLSKIEKEDKQPITSEETVEVSLDMPADARSMLEKQTNDVYQNTSVTEKLESTQSESELQHKNKQKTKHRSKHKSDKEEKKKKKRRENRNSDSSSHREGKKKHKKSDHHERVVSDGDLSSC